MTVRAVLFDWRGTLVTTRGPKWAVERALAVVGRPATDQDVDHVLSAVLAANGPENRLDTPGMDCDATRHRAISMSVFREAGLDNELAEALYAVDADPDFTVFATDVPATLRSLRGSGIAVGVVSDIHFDLRPLFARVGCLELVDAFTLSFEIGAQKPDPVVFEHALGALGVAPDEALMVGDRSGPDGGAVESGVTTLLLPPLRDPVHERLHRVLALCASRGSGIP